MATVTVQDGQNIFDVCLQEFGTLEELSKFLEDNDLTLNTKLTAGRELIVNKANVGDENVKDFVVLKDITFNNDQGFGQPPLLAGDYNDDYSNDSN